jgi:hypothetical protein
MITDISGSHGDEYEDDSLLRHSAVQPLISSRIIVLMMDELRTSETSASFYESIRPHIPEGCDVYTTVICHF